MLFYAAALQTLNYDWDTLPWEPIDAVVACLTGQSRCLQETRGSNMLESEFQIGNSGLKNG